MGKYYLGIDTSAYTTSMSIINNNDKIIYDLRKILDVKKGSKGLRQQEAIFQHMNNINILLENIDDFDFKDLELVSFSSRPRNISDSYMPVFLQGKNLGLIISRILNIDYKEFSHQEGHIAIGIMENKDLIDSKFMSMHISGGTTELLKIEDNKDNLDIDLLGGSLDISYGQLIDRIGVYIGLKFPCGKEMDKISKDGEILDLDIKSDLKKDYLINISGMENYFKDLIDSKKYRNKDIIKSLFHFIVLSMERLIIKSSREYNIDRYLITGGVASNTYIRDELYKRLDKEDIKIYFPSPKNCVDNSLGIAYLGKYKTGII